MKSHNEFLDEVKEVLRPFSNYSAVLKNNRIVITTMSFNKHFTYLILRKIFGYCVANNLLLTFLNSKIIIQGVEDIE